MIELIGYALSRALVAQLDPGVNIDSALGEGLAGSAIGAFLTTLIVGGIMVAVVPEYTERMMGIVLDDPIGSAIYGLLSLVVITVLAILLVITLVGILLALPLLVVAYVVWAIGSAIAFLAIAERLVGREEGWLKPLLVAAGLSGLLVVTGIGGLIAFAIGATGFGAILRSWLA